MTKIRIAALVIMLALFTAACGGGGGDGDDGGGTTPTATDAPDDGGDGDGAVLHLTAPAGSANSGWTEKELSAPADTPFTIHLENADDGIPHNVQIYEGEGTSGTRVWAPEGDAMITGPDAIDYEIPALAAGTYTYNCFAHPVTMVGTLTVG